MIWALLAILFFGSSGASPAPALEAVGPRLREVVADKDRLAKAEAIFGEFEKAADAHRARQAELLESWGKLARTRELKAVDLEKAIAAFAAENDAFSAKALDHRFALRGVLTRDEWTKLFDAPLGRPIVPELRDRPQTLDGRLVSRIGRLDFEHGYLSKDSVRLAYDELDFQRACQSYIWALPIVGFAQFQASARESFGATDLDYVIYRSVEDKLGFLTPNATTPYVVAFSDLARTGPLVIEVPPGASAGGVLDFWQRPVTDTGLAGPDKGTGAKYLVLPPGYKNIDDAGYRVIKSPTFSIFIGHRALDPDAKKADAWIRSLRLYPYAQRSAPPQTKFLSPNGRPWTQVPPRGLAYWARLDEVLEREPVEPRDRFFAAMLVELGIERGKPFAPSVRQRAILEDAAFAGEAMSMALAFDKRAQNARYRPDANWLYGIMLDPTQEAEGRSLLDERTDYFYQAVTTTSGMTTKTPGVGQAYLGTYGPADGGRFDGGRLYRLRVPPNAPAKQFWSLTLYDVDTRSFIVTDQMIADRSSRMDLIKNPDGSVDLYMGPRLPGDLVKKGLEKNWIPTAPGRGWFAMFRLYAPTEAYFDSSWPLPSIEAVR